jgi:acyl transferase domain-containing protein
MRPWLEGAFTARFLVDPRDAEAAREAERALERAEIVQPAVLAVNTMLARALHRYGVRPDYAFGHSLGEYSALVEAGTFPFAHALEMVSLLHPAVREAARRCGGAMAVVMGAPERVSALLAELAPDVQLANINSPKQCVIGGATAAVEVACQALAARGLEAARLPVTHAFHTTETTPIGEGMGQVVASYGLRLPSIPVVAGATGELYPRDVDGMIDLLRRHPAATVQWIKGLETLFREGVRTFVEVGPKKVLKGLADDLFCGRADVLTLFSCHPKSGEVVSFNRALCGLYAAGLAAPYGSSS